MAEATVNLYTRIPESLNNQLEQHMKDTGETKQEIVRKALEAYLKNN